jgi:predicted RNase H-like HicB family nuclease
MHYAIVLHKDPGSDYGVTVPDLPGCFSAGATVDEALSRAAEAIELHLEGLLAEGRPIPPRSSIEAHKENPPLPRRNLGCGPHRPGAPAPGIIRTAGGIRP